MGTTYRVPAGLRISKILLAGIIGLDLGMALFLLQHPKGDGLAALGDRELLAAAPAVTRVGANVALTDSLRPITETVRVDGHDLNRVLDVTPLTCHGGRARVTWHVGNLEPTVAMTGIAISARFDGQVIGSLLRGSTNGIYNDAPASIMAVVDCPVGEHVLDVQITQINGGWGLPYVLGVGREADHLQMNRGFIVMEVW